MLFIMVHSSHGENVNEGDHMGLTRKVYYCGVPDNKEGIKKAPKSYHNYKTGVILAVILASLLVFLRKVKLFKVELQLLTFFEAVIT
jgi:hypothetical protein